MAKSSQIRNPVLADEQAEQINGPTRASEQLEELEVRQAVHEHKVDNVDREAIDRIILSDDVQKGGKIRIERKGPLDRDYQWVTNIPADQWKDTGSMLEWFKNMFGGGDYKASTFRSNGQRYKPFSFSIDYRFKGQLDQDQLAQLRGDPNKNDVLTAKLLDMVMKPQPIQAARDDGFKASDMIKIMEMGQGKSEQMMTLIMSMMMKSQETMATVLAAAISAGSNNKQQGIDPVIIDLLKQKAERTPLSEVLDTMKAIKELTAPTEEEPEKEETIWDKILKFAPVLFPQLQGGAPPANQIPVQVMPQNQIVQPQPSQMPNEMQAALSSLVRAAERNSDPSLYADLILDNLQGQPEQLQSLRTILTDPGWKSKLWGDESKVAHIASWLDELRSMILIPDEDATTSNIPEQRSQQQPGGPGAPVQPGSGPGADPQIP